jgi:hypothetical protein
VTASPVPLSPEVPLRRDQGSSSLASFPPEVPCSGDPLPFTGSSRGEFPGFIGTMGRSDSLPSVPTGFVSSPVGYRSRGEDRVSQVPGGPTRACPALRPRRDLRAWPLRRFGAAFRHHKGVGSRKILFRGSITRPTRSLSTLRSPSCPGTTQDSLPAGGQPLPGGGRAPAGSLRRFRRLTCLLLLHQASLAHCDRS